MATTHTWVDDTKEYARGHWREILVQLGVEVPAMSHKHGACPGCGGTDRFRFDDKGGRGSFIWGPLRKRKKSYVKLLRRAAAADIYPA